MIIKKYEQFVRENYEPEMSPQEDPAQVQVQVQEEQYNDEDIPEVQVEDDDYAQEEEPVDIETIEITYDSKKDEWTSNDEIELPEDFEVFDEWFMNISEDEEGVSKIENNEEDLITYHIPLEVYDDFIGVQTEPIVDDLDDDGFEDEELH